MQDARIDKLAKMLVNFSTKVQPGYNVLVHSQNDNLPLVKSLVREIYAAGGVPFVWMENSQVERELAFGYTEAQLKLRAEADSLIMSNMQSYIGISSLDNSFEMCDVPTEKQSMCNMLYREPVHGEIRVRKTHWVVLRYPTFGMAQASKMSTEAFEDFYFDVCTMDYSKMDAAMEPLKQLMDKTDMVRITAKDTDISFSIKGLPAVKCAGEMNIPDGEIFTAPVKDSVNGVITYNTPSMRNGFSFENVKLTFKDGKIVKAEANDNERVNAIFDMDEGARYVGEFALGVNPYILTPMNNTLFDEKIMGSLHFTPGRCYDTCDNGNRSALHWDLVLIQTPEYGGGDMYFDGVLVRHDGRFVLPELQALNPENLK